MDTADFASDLAKAASKTEPRDRLIRSSWRGAKRGFRYTSLVFFPLSWIILILALVPTAIGMGARRGFGIHPAVINAGAFYLVGTIWGAIFGAIIALIAALIRKARGQRGPGAWSAFLNRPIRLFSRRSRNEAELAVVPGSEVVTRRRRWKLWIWLLIVPGWVVVATAFGFGIYAGRFVDQRLAEAIAAADRDDPGWRLNDQMAAREDVPDEENSALIVAEVNDRLPSGWPTDPRKPENPPPPDNVRMSDAEADTLREELQEVEDVVLLARTVASYRRGRHEVELTPAIVDTRLPETQNARTVARLLQSDAEMRVHDGDADGALESCRALLAVGRSIGDEPFLISGLVKIAIGGVSINSARRVLALGEPSDAALARYQHDVLAALDEPILLRGLRFEMATLDEIIRRVRDGEISISDLSEGDGTRAVANAVSAIAPWGRLWFDHQRAVGLEWSREMVAIARRPVFERPPLWKAWDDEMSRVKSHTMGMLGAVVPLLMMPASQAVSVADARYRSEMGAMAILLACERHRLKTGSWPESIAAIDPAILPDPPLDPFTGQPFLMEHDDSGLVIHTVGPNLKDEHGDFNYRTAMKGGPDDYGSRAWNPSRRNQPAPD